MRLSSAWVKIHQIPQFWNDKSIPSQFCISLQFHEILFICFFLAQTIYTLLNRSLLKWKFLRLSSARVKFCQIPSANFETTCRFLSNFFYLFSVSWKVIPLYFFSSKNTNFAQKEPSKMENFETLKCLGQILSRSLCQFWKDESIPP